MRVRCLPESGDEDREAIGARVAPRQLGSRFDSHHLVGIAEQSEEQRDVPRITVHPEARCGDRADDGVRALERGATELREHARTADKLEETARVRRGGRIGIQQRDLLGRLEESVGRRRQLLALARLIRDNAPVLVEALTADLNRPRMESAVAELSECLSAALKAAERFEEWAAPEALQVKEAWRAAWGATLHKEPKGVVFIIA